MSAAQLLDPAFLRRLQGLTLRARRRYEGRRTGAKKTPRRGAGLEFASHRPYVAGDDLRHLDWPLYARLGRPFVKIYEEERDLPVHLLVDTSPSMGFGEPTKQLAAARLAAALGHVALASLDRVGAAFYDRRGLRIHNPARGQDAFFPLLRFLAAADADGASTVPSGGSRGESSATSALRLHVAAARPGLTFVLSDFLDPDFDATLRSHVHRRHSLVLIQVLAPEELEPVLDGDLELVDSEDGGKVSATIDRRVVAAYRARLAAHREKLRGFGKRYGAEVFSFSSALGLEAALHELLGGTLFGHV